MTAGAGAGIDTTRFGAGVRAISNLAKGSSDPNAKPEETPKPVVPPKQVEASVLSCCYGCAMSNQNAIGKEKSAFGTKMTISKMWQKG
eukprot:12040895-Ditylum_brightwellii.AAC.1